MKVAEILHGFRIDRVRENAELGGKLWEMTHVHSGAQLVWLDNGENNKLFSIAFKTLPSDDTGVFHILEHSVLCGSKKYPVKEPFVELLKSSMNTFLNAMTFPDKTVYPVSSRNEQDFMNLTEVYLDAVFAPAIYENPCIFQQEGWHYELHEGEETSTFKGVVFNEMKGAFSSPDTLITNALCRMLYPDNCYGYESGGDPKHIPELTYEQFLDAHREYYHPSNARIYLDGAVPLQRVLVLLDEYLSQFTASEKRHDIHEQAPISAAETVENYAIGEEEDPAYMAHMAMGKVVCDWSDRKKLMALMVLGSYLTGSNEAPLKRAILSNGLAQDVGIGVMDGLAQPYCMLQIRNTEYSYREHIQNVIRQTVQTLLDSGLDAEELEAVINQMEFQMLQVDEPKGLMRNITMLNSWLYGGDPMLYLTHSDLFAQLRSEIGTGYYEMLLRDTLLDDSNMAQVFLLPSQTKGAEDSQAESERLVKTAAGWSAEERSAVLEMNRHLEEWQSTPDAAEALATLPMLSLDEVATKPERTETEIRKVDNTTILLHKVPGTGIVHINLYFSLADFSADDLSAISFMTNLLGELPTKHHTVEQLQRLIKKNIGALDFNVTAYPHKNDSTKCRPEFCVSCSVLEERVSAAVDILTEILCDTLYTGEEAAASIGEILLQGEEGMRQAVMMEGHRFAGMRAQSHFTAAGAAQERMTGFDFYCWLRDFAQNMEQRVEHFQSFAQTAAQRIFASRRMTLSITAQEPCVAVEAIIAMLAKNCEDIPEYMTISVDKVAAKEAIRIPSGISYAVSAGNLQQYGSKYDGGLGVLSSILSYGYLWNEVRVQGGAYGCGFRVGELGNAMFYSYRDPDPHRSLSVFDDTAAFVRQLSEPLDKYIISTIASTEPLRTPTQQGAMADSDYFCGITYEDRCRTRSQMLNLKQKDLPRYCALFDAMAQNNARCIVGSSDALTECNGEWTVYTL